MCLWNPKNYCVMNTAPSLPQTCTEVSPAPNMTILIVKSHSILNVHPLLQVFWGAPENALAESEFTLQSSRGAWERLEVLRSTGERYWSDWEVCVWLPDRFTYCWCRNSSRLSLWVWFLVWTELLSTGLSGSPMNLDRQSKHDLMELFQLLWIWRVVSGLSCESIYQFIYWSCFCCMIIGFYQYCLFNFQYSLFASFEVCNIDYFGICVACYIVSIFAYQSS